MNNNLIIFGVGIVGVAAVFLIIAGLNELKKLKETTKDEKTKNALDRLDKIIKKAVGAANQVVVRHAKEDGTFTPSLGKKVKDEVVENVLKVFGDEGKSLLKESLGNLSEYIDMTIEDEVGEQKK